MNNVKMDPLFLYRSSLPLAQPFTAFITALQSPLLFKNRPHTRRNKICRPKEGGVTNKGAWTTGEDKILIDYIRTHGEGRWRKVPREAGLKRCGKSCRLRWLNYLRPDIKRGNFTIDEKDLIFRLHRLLGNRWSLIAKRLPGRTDNEVKNYWNSYLSKKQKSIQANASKNHPPFAFPCNISNEPPNTDSPTPENCTALTGFDAVQNYVVEEQLSPGSSALDLTISFDIGDFILPELFDYEFDGELCDLDACNVNNSAADKIGTSKIGCQIETAYFLPDYNSEKETAKNWSGGDCWGAEATEDWIMQIFSSV